MVRIIFLIITQILLLCACQVPTSFFESQPGAVLYQDDFSDPTSGWEIFNNPERGTMDYFDTFYRIHVLGEYQMLSTGPGLDFTDVQLEADMLKVVGSSDDMFGLVCRVANPENFYFFVISSDGYYGIGKVIDGDQMMLGSQGMLPSEMIFQGTAKNHLRADCIEEELILSVNGQELIRIEDHELERGDVGILAATMQDAENVVLYDNFSVINP